MHRVQFPSYGTIGNHPPPRTLFKTHGFFSTEVHKLRRSVLASEQGRFEAFITAIEYAHLEYVSVTIPSTKPSWAAIAFWLRCLESAQGAVLLADMGMGGTAAAALRTSIECLFHACALWRNPELVVRLTRQHEIELRKAAKKIMDAPDGMIDDFNDELCRYLEPETDAERKQPGLSVYAAAVAADMEKDYNIFFRSLSMLGSHATPRSLHHLAPDATRTVMFGPNHEHWALLCGLAGETVRVARSRFREQFSSFAFETPSPE